MNSQISTMKNLLTLQILLILFITACSEEGWHYYTEYFYGGEEEGYILQDTDMGSLVALENQERIAKTFGGIMDSTEIASSKFYYHTWHYPGYMGFHSFTILVASGPGECNRTIYWFTTHNLDVLDWKKVAYEKCNLEIEEFQDYRTNIFDNGFVTRNISKQPNDLTETSWREHCKIDSLGKFDCVRKALVSAVVLKDSAYYKRKPEKKFGYRKKIPIGEMLYSESIYQTDQIQDRKYPYTQVMLADEEEGWVESKYLVENARPAVIIEKTKIFSSPNGRSNGEFQKFDFLAVQEKDTTGHWFRVTGKSFDDKDSKSGWIRGDSFSFFSADIEFSRYVWAGTKEDLSEGFRTGKFDAVNPMLKTDFIQ